MGNRRETNRSVVTVMSKFDAAINELLQEPSLREAYDQQAAIIHVAQMIRHWRDEASLTQSELAKRVNTKQAVISRLESSDNESMPNLETLIQIAHACGQRLLLGAEDAGHLANALEADEVGDYHENLLAL